MLQLAGAGLKGWQWLFILQACRGRLAGVSFFALTDRPDKAKWLQPEEARWLSATLRAEAEARDIVHRQQLRDVFWTALLAILAYVIRRRDLPVRLSLWLPQVNHQDFGGLTTCRLAFSPLPVVLARS